MNCLYFESPTELLDWLKKQLTIQSVVGTGDSVTLEELGIFHLLRSLNVTFLDKQNPKLSREDKNKLYLQNFSADFFLSGINAVSLTGEIVQIDGNGSRVAPLLWGPKKVFLIAGTNKIEPTLEEAQNRARKIAAPLDAKRLGKQTPCVYTNNCQDCKSPDRICNSFVTISGQFDPERITLCLIKGNYGY